MVVLKNSGDKRTQLFADPEHTADSCSLSLLRGCSQLARMALEVIGQLGPGL